MVVEFRLSGIRSFWGFVCLKGVESIGGFANFAGIEEIVVLAYIQKRGENTDIWVLSFAVERRTHASTLVDVREIAGVGGVAGVGRVGGVVGVGGVGVVVGVVEIVGVGVVVGVAGVVGVGGILTCRYRGG